MLLQLHKVMRLQMLRLHAILHYETAMKHEINKSVQSFALYVACNYNRKLLGHLSGINFCILLKLKKSKVCHWKFQLHTVMLLQFKHWQSQVLSLHIIIGHQTKYMVLTFVSSYQVSLRPISNLLSVFLKIMALKSDSRFK